MNKMLFINSKGCTLFCPILFVDFEDQNKVWPNSVTFELIRFGLIGNSLNLNRDY